jgi:hypothetical protein
MVIWTVAEPGLAITAGNLAAIRPLLRKLCGRTSSKGASVSDGAYPPTDGAKAWNKGQGRSQDVPFDLSSYLVEETTPEDKKTECTTTEDTKTEAAPMQQENRRDDERKPNLRVPVMSPRTRNTIWHPPENWSQEDLCSKTKK